MDELVQWLRAQLDEDKRIVEVALRYVDADWRRDDEENVALASSLTLAGKQEVAITADRWRRSMIEGPGVVMHVAEHDPARVLREVDAKGRILDLFATAVDDRVALRTRMREVIDTDPDEFGRLHREESKLIEAAEYLAPVVRLLALPYADRPGYRDDWRP
ncbi:DUF6221 family protein [Streptomyces rochei]|uniref:DUF6221 family protein n=1 Tax=Streptomyces rochei TaxID=1928 RepID=UPI00367A2A1A